MTLFVDADSCPVRIREILCKTALRLQCNAVFVANRFVPIKKNKFCTSVITSTDDQAADSFILAQAQLNDIVITRDIPLAKVLVDKGICVINDRGTVYTAENIGERLSLRDFMYDLQSLGLVPEKTSSFGKKEIMIFSQSLDKETSRLLRKEL